MAAVLEVKYFNSYWLKKIKSIQSVIVTETTEDDHSIFSFTLGNNYLVYTPIPYSAGTPPVDYLVPVLDNIGAGQRLSYEYLGIVYNYVILGYVASSTPGDYKIYLDRPITSPSFVSNPFVTPASYVELLFGKIIDFNYVPGSAQYTINGQQDWFIEESRIRGGYNNVSTDLGVRAYIVEEAPNRQNRTSSLIYSGIFNSRTGINNTNQFSVAEDITKTLDPAQGSIQKLYAEDTNLIILQELKVSRALIDKNAIYSAEGDPITTSSNTVIGQIQGYAGNYGISTNPESFAVYGYRKYFVDRNQNAVLRLSQDGITEISNTGMLDYFRDNLGNIDNTGKIIGSWDMHNKQYVLSLQPALSQNAARSSNPGFVTQYQTLAFDEDSLGWTSRFSFRPDNGFSLLGNYYTAFNGNIWKHYSTFVPYANFYNIQYNSTVTVIFNPEPSYAKTFRTINYEGSGGWALTKISTDYNNGVPINAATMTYSLGSLEDQLFTNNFKVKENKYFGTIINNNNPTEGAVVYGQSMSGIAGFYAIGTFTFPDTNQSAITYTNPARLFAVSSTFSESLSN